MPEPATYSEYTHNGLKMHLCECEDADNCTFYSCNITGEPSQCEVVGCEGHVLNYKSEGPIGVDRCTQCEFYLA